MRPLLLIIIIIGLIISSSCSSDCQGVTGTNDTAIILSTSVHDTLHTTSGRYRHDLQITIEEARFESEPSKPNCMTKVSKTISHTDPIIDSTLIITCNRDLISYNTIIPAGQNMLEFPNVKRSIQTFYYMLESGTVNIDVDSIETGNHIYYITCTTKKGNTLTDSIHVYYQ